MTSDSNLIYRLAGFGAAVNIAAWLEEDHVRIYVDSFSPIIVPEDFPLIISFNKERHSLEIRRWTNDSRATSRFGFALSTERLQSLQQQVSGAKRAFSRLLKKLKSGSKVQD